MTVIWTGSLFVIQYECKDIDDFLAYQTTQAPGLQKAHAERYGETVIAFRTIMELLEEQTGTRPVKYFLFIRI